MKKLPVIYMVFLFSCFTIQAQTIKLGIKGKKAEGELLATDPKFSDGSRHFQSIPFTLKAGQGIVFYIRSTSFTPLIVLSGNNGTGFGTLRSSVIDSEKEARVAFIAQKRLYADNARLLIPCDSSFQVIFTSQEENATGKFSYGYRMIDSLQMVYDENYSFCNRLAFLINQWLANWDIIPESGINLVPHTNNLTYFTLMPDKTGSSLTTGTGSFLPNSMDKKASYSEVMFNSKTEKGGSFYDEVVKNIQACLGEADWIFESEELKESNYTRNISHFYKNGVSKESPHASFKVIWNMPSEINSIFQNEVILVFD